MRSALGGLVVLAVAAAATLAWAVLPPRAYESRRVKAGAVFLARVVQVHKAGTSRHYTVMLAQLKVVEVFRGSPPASGAAKVRYAYLAPGDNPPPGPTIYHSLKPGELVLVFAASFDGKTKAACLLEAGQATGAAAGAKMAKTVGFYQRMAGSLAADTGQPPAESARARSQVEMYQRIIAYLQTMK